MATTAPTVRSLDQILAELGTVYNPQIKSLQTRMSDIPGQIKAEQAGLQAKQEQAFGDILSGARRRGTGVAFGGIPLAEQAKYTATEFLPAQARLQQSGREQAMTLQDAINQIQERRQSTALAQQQYEQQRRDAYDSERRSLAASAAASDLSKYFQMMNQQNTTTSTPSMVQTKGSTIGSGSFAFYDANKNPITAAQYAKSTGNKIGDVLRHMGDNGDIIAQQLYSQLANVANSPTLYKESLNYYKQEFPYILGGV